jgi:uncharacterized protein (DUF1330 family)
MPAYVIGKVTVTDRDRYREYAKLTPGVIAKFGGRFLARGGEVVTLEGPEERQRVAVIEFPSLERAKEFYDSEDYRKLRKLREGAATVSLIAVAQE